MNFVQVLQKSTCTSGRLSRGICENSLLSNDMLGSKILEILGKIMGINIEKPKKFSKNFDLFPHFFTT